MFFALRFLVTGNASFIAGKLREAINMALEQAKQMSAQLAAIINLFIVSVVNTDTTISISILHLT